LCSTLHPVLRVVLPAPAPARARRSTLHAPHPPTTHTHTPRACAPLYALRFTQASTSSGVP
jgi:hypothetical protein